MVDWKNIDWKKLWTDFQEELTNFIKNPKPYLQRWFYISKDYFNNLTLYENFAWVGNAVGFLLLIIGVILW